jgi:molybdopterin converting factor small subunit
MQQTVLTFGQITSITGSQVLHLDTTVQDTAALKTLLQQRYPALEGTGYAIAVNRKITADNTALHPGDEIALLPPFSGG